MCFIIALRLIKNWNSLCMYIFATHFKKQIEAFPSKKHGVKTSINLKKSSCSCQAIRDDVRLDYNCIFFKPWNLWYVWTLIFLSTNSSLLLSFQITSFHIIFTAVQVLFSNETLYKFLKNNKKSPPTKMFILYKRKIWAKEETRTRYKSNKTKG